ncbi:MAG: excinuclease ABC subunit UvrC [Planctomycetales bacterium]|nr:excinuclease ABC subunit UvrC [Planctomycetales bacterium]
MADDYSPLDDDDSWDEPDDEQFAEEAADQIVEANIDEHAVEAALEHASQGADDPSAADFLFRQAAAKVRLFPRAPGVYLFKDSVGRVIYVGKAKTLRSRAGSYFLPAASEEYRTATWVHEIADADYVECESEVDALLMESRLIKDIQPRHNKELKDDKTFPYLQITTHEDFPRVEVTRKPRDRGVKLYGPFASAGALRGAIQVLQRVFQFRTCSLDIETGDPRWQWFRPCLLASIKQCTAPCNFRISKEDYRRDIKRLQQFLEGNKKQLIAQMKFEMQEAAGNLQFEKAARLRDEINMLEKLDRRGEIDTHAQPEVFYIDPKKGLAGLRKVLGLRETPRTIEGVDIAHLGGNETVASLVQFLDGLPFKPGYRRYKIREVAGIDDFRSIHEVVARRFRRLSDDQATFPDILLIDGGKGQLNAALAAFHEQEITPPTLLSLAKQEEEIYLPGEREPLRLNRNSFALRLLQYVRDEAHRFAQHYHHILRRKSTLGE